MRNDAGKAWFNAAGFVCAETARCGVEVSSGIGVEDKGQYLVTLITDGVCHARPYFTSVMKRILQSVALALAVFLAVQPALATMTCAQRICADGSSSPDCCLPSSDASMNGMANDMDMPSMSASGQAPSFVAAIGASCVSAPCCTMSTVSAQQLAAPVKFSLTGAVSLTLVSELSSVVAPVRAGRTRINAVAPALDRYVLFHVFRI
jgi:hypothetical protein